MKGLRKYLAPFAPDQSGAVAVLYALGGILVICDAGGCAGNICGFDEPRWFTQKSAIFSAGLRDMDAILGRDVKLVNKLQSAAEELDSSFAAIIGTPVPAVIATDYTALRRMAERRLSLPVIAVDTSGMALYDEGAEKAYLALVKRFSQDGMPVEPGRIGVLGLTPLDFASPQAEARLRQRLKNCGFSKICIYGMEGLEEIKLAGQSEKNLVIAPSGLQAAQYLQEKFGTPYECYDPLAEDCAQDLFPCGKRVLIIHQQIRANTLRLLLEQQGAKEVTVATWFMKKPELSRSNDLQLTEEDQLQDLLESGAYDIVIADRDLWQIAPDFTGEWVELSHFAVSGRVEEPWM